MENQGTDADFMSEKTDFKKDYFFQDEVKIGDETIFTIPLEN